MLTMRHDDDDDASLHRGREMKRTSSTLPCTRYGSSQGCVRGKDFPSSPRGPRGVGGGIIYTPALPVFFALPTIVIITILLIVHNIHFYAMRPPWYSTSTDGLGTFGIGVIHGMVRTHFILANLIIFGMLFSVVFRAKTELKFSFFLVTPKSKPWPPPPSTTTKAAAAATSATLSLPLPQLLWPRMISPPPPLPL